jgi:hypothetical protein
MWRRKHASEHNTTPTTTKQNKSGEGGDIDELTVDVREIEQRVAAGESRATPRRRQRRIASALPNRLCVAGEM